MKGGVYNLIIKLSKSKEINIGRLGTFVFPKGFYVYTGSAQNGLEKRINRHISGSKKVHWHIDYLLSYAKIVKVLRYIGDRNAECKLSCMIGGYDGSDVIVNRFGSSDCDCVTHLYYFKNMPGIEDLRLHNT
jgi:Uri superfamily endonuclease